MHPRSTSQISSLICGAVIAASFMPAVVHAQATAKTAKLTPALLATRTALDKYKDPMVAVRDGYFSTVACIEFHGGGPSTSMEYKPGAMGVHFLNLGLVGPKLDSTKPQVLLYEPVGDKLVLVGAEWFVPAATGQDAADDLRPQAHGADGRAPADHAGRLHHWDLHVWLWKDNPNGMFSATNSA